MKTLPDVLIVKIFEELGFEDLLRAANVNSKFFTLTRNSSLWENAVQRTDLSDHIKKFITEPNYNMKNSDLALLQIKERYREIKKAIKKISYLSDEQRLYLMRISLTHAEAIVFINLFPKNVIQAIKAHPIPNTTIYKATLPENSTFWQLVGSKPQLAIGLLNGTIYEYLSQEPKLLTVPLLATLHEQVAMLILQNPAKYEHIIAHENFLSPLKEHLKCYKLVINSTELRNIIGEDNLSSLYNFYKANPSKLAPFESQTKKLKM